MQGSASEIFNFALKVMNVVGKLCSKIFDLSSSVTSVEICGFVSNQWLHYQLQENLDNFYLQTNDWLQSKGRKNVSYWKEALGQFEIEDAIDHHWDK